MSHQLDPKDVELKVFYDGLCVLCSREIEHYRKQTGSEQIAFIDICSADFNAAAEGLDPVAIHKVMHVRKKDGSLATRVDAFIEIWRVLPKYRWLARLASSPGVRQSLELGYSAFARIRPWLPRRDQEELCAQSPYCEVSDSKVARS